jgi:hypothetical protein
LTFRSVTLRRSRDNSSLEGRRPGLSSFEARLLSNLAPQDDGQGFSPA